MSRGEAGVAPAAPRAGSSRAERDAARRSRAAAGSSRRGPGERPPAPWGNFPLAELLVLLALVLGILGFVIWGRRGQTMVAAAAALGSLAGLEISIREHFAGYRSHTTLLAGAPAIASIIIVGLALGAGSYAVSAAAGILVFGLAFWALREVFKRRSGGLSFR